MSRPGDTERRTHRRTVSGLVLFVGAPAGAAVRDALARDGLRSLWLAEPARALLASSALSLDAVVLDAPIDVLARMRASHRGPLVVVGDPANEEHELAALEQGADAVLSRPLAPRRLRAHLAALLRLRMRAGQAGEPPRPEPAAAGWALDCIGRRIVRDGHEVELTELQAALLQCLFEQRGRIVSRVGLAAALPNGSDIDVRSVDVYVHRLRRRLHAENVRDLSVETVRGRGFRLPA